LTNRNETEYDEQATSNNMEISSHGQMRLAIWVFLLLVMLSYSCSNMQITPNV